MTCSASATSPNTQFYNDFEYMPPEEDLIETSLGSDDKDLKSRSVVVLSNTVRKVAVIEAIRFLAVIGLVCSAVASVLLPALGFAAIAAGACVLKNRAIQLDAKTQKDSDVAAGGISNRILRSASTASQTSQGKYTGTMLRMGSVRSNATTSLNPISENTPESAPTSIKEAFLNSLGDRGSLNIEDLNGLLAICYFYLLEKTPDMPKSLTKEGLLSPSINTQMYFEKKFKDCFAKTSAEFKNSATVDDKGRQIPAVNEKQKSLESANPSLIMETVQELHQQISKEQNKHENKKEANHHADNAKHAGEYIIQLKAFESQKNLCFTEDTNYA